MKLSLKLNNWKAMLLVVFIAFLPFHKVLAEVAVVVNKSNTSSFDDNTIKRMFLGKAKTYSNGKSVILVSVGYGDAATDEFNSKVIGKSSSQVKAYWSRILFTGKGTPPQEMSSSAEVISTVANNPDAIGYVDASAVNDTVKVIATYK
jgi:ABC-type phosphate transport system substrate-binding protein